MSPADVSRQTSPVEGDKITWSWGAARPKQDALTKTALSSASKETPATSPGTHAPSLSCSQERLSPPFDHTGQGSSSAVRTRITTTFWEDEDCRCFLIDAEGACVARREDNDMINGTKLLNFAGMTRGRRDGILKSEKSRYVVRVGPAHLKGIWIPFDRALWMAKMENITELLYPLFMDDIGSLIGQPSDQKLSDCPESQHKAQKSSECIGSKDNYINRIGLLENSSESLQRFRLDTVRRHELYEQGPIGSLYKSLIETLGLILIEVKTRSDMVQHYDSLEKGCAALFFWGDDLGLWRGELDNMLQDSPQLRDTCLTVLVSICQLVSTSLIHIISSEHRRSQVLQSTGISTSLEQTVNMIEQQHQPTYRPEQDVGALCQTLRTKIDTLIMLAPSLASPAEESFDDEEPRAIQDIKEHLPEQAYASSVSQKFPRAAPGIVARLGKLNWDRYNHVLRLQRETMQRELQTTALEKAKTIFHDSGLGISLPTKSEAELEIAVNPSRPESAYAPSVVSSRAEASHKRVPPLSADAREGKPFTCEICNKQVAFRRTKAWKKHVFDDILAYVCFFAECCDTQVFFENSEALMNHLQDHHGMDVRVSDVTCPLCVEFTCADRDALSLHIARHMEEVALAVLPSGVESDEESTDASVSEVCSDDDHLEVKFRELKNRFRELRIKRRLLLGGSEMRLGDDDFEMRDIYVKLLEVLHELDKREEAETMDRQLRGQIESLQGQVESMITFLHSKTTAKSNSTSSVTSSIDRDFVSGIEAEVGSEYDGDEPRYCHCKKVAYGNMVACDNDDCAREWFHLACVNLEKPPTGRAKWYCSDECKDAHAKAKKRQVPVLEHRDTPMPALPTEKEMAMSSDMQQLLGISPGSQEDAPISQPGASPRQSNYWSASELQDFDKNIEHFGTDWTAIANRMDTKTRTMIKNQYHRLIENGRLDLQQMAMEAEARKPTSALILTAGTEVLYRCNSETTDLGPLGIDSEGVLCRITAVIGEGNQRRYEIIEVELDPLRSTSPFRASGKSLIAIPPNNILSDLEKGEKVLALYPGRTKFYKAEVVVGWRMSHGKVTRQGGGRRKNLVQLRFAGELETLDVRVERRYILPG